MVAHVNSCLATDLSVKREQLDDCWRLEKRALRARSVTSLFLEPNPFQSARIRRKKKGNLAVSTSRRTIVLGQHGNRVLEDEAFA
jgi:hypothetical protein